MSNNNINFGQPGVILLLTIVVLLAGCCCWSAVASRLDDDDRTRETWSIIKGRRQSRGANNKNKNKNKGKGKGKNNKKQQDHDEEEEDVEYGQQQQQQQKLPPRYECDRTLLRTRYCFEQHAQEEAAETKRAAAVQRRLDEFHALLRQTGDDDPSTRKKLQESIAVATQELEQCMAVLDSLSALEESILVPKHNNNNNGSNSRAAASSKTSTTAPPSTTHQYEYY